MTYSDIKTLASKRGYSMGEVAEHVQITPEGLKRAIDRCTLGMRHVVRLCDIVGITPNMLFGFKSKPIAEIAIENTGLQNTQNINTQAADTIKALQEQLVEKDRQLAEKDRHIAKLLDILAKQ